MFRDRFRRGGGAPKAFDTIASLIAASEEGNLAPGYYEVLTVPVNHPQHPRVVTYWDGVIFEPQISTGFELRPYQTNERFVWDIDEYRLQVKVPDGTPFVGCTGLEAAPVPLTLQQPYFRDTMATLEAEGLRSVAVTGYEIATTGAASTVSLIYAGVATVPNLTALAHALAFGQDLGSISITYFGGYGWCIAYNYNGEPLYVLPRAVGDIVIVSFSGTQWVAWVNGVKFGPYAKTFDFGGGKVTFLNYLSSAQGFAGDSYFARVSSDVIDDTAAAAWTAWLQDRYGIPPL